MNFKNFKILEIRNKFISLKDPVDQMKNDLFNFFQSFNPDQKLIHQKCLNPFNIHLFQRILINSIAISQKANGYFLDIFNSFFQVYLY